MKFWDLSTGLEPELICWVTQMSPLAPQLWNGDNVGPNHRVVVRKSTGCNTKSKYFICYKPSLQVTASLSQDFHPPERRAATDCPVTLHVSRWSSNSLKNTETLLCLSSELVRRAGLLKASLVIYVNTLIPPQGPSSITHLRTWKRAPTSSNRETGPYSKPSLFRLLSLHYLLILLPSTSRRQELPWQGESGLVPQDKQGGTLCLTGTVSD